MKTDLVPSALTGIEAAIHRTITGQPISMSINILKDVKFTQANTLFANHITSVGTVNNNTRIQLNLEIWRN